MNFVDVQPKSFLDYAWTSPTPTVNGAATSSKAGRRQNRCCDQCRKGKRACDAAILEDLLLDTGKTGDHPSVFHYSGELRPARQAAQRVIDHADVYGPLAACGNCTKTKKDCTFEWLRTQRVSQATQPCPSTVPPAKRRRTNSNTKSSHQKSNVDAKTSFPAKSMCRSNNAESGTSINSLQMGMTFGDFPGVPTYGIASLTSASPDLWYDGAEVSTLTQLERYNDVFANGDSPLICESEQDSSQKTSPGSVKEIEENRSRNQSSEDSMGSSDATAKAESAVLRVGRKRRRRNSSIPLSNGALPYPAISFAAEFISSANKAFLKEGLLKIYHDSFENALSCWLTERTCPYSTKADISLANDGGPDWNRIYHRVFRLDRLASSIRGRQLTFDEDKAVSKAVNLAIFSFATQWAQQSQRSRAKYPFDHNDLSEDAEVLFTDQNAEVPSCQDKIEFDRSLQVAAWNEARSALHNAGEIESFRLVLAQIVFSLTQRPSKLEDDPVFRSAKENVAPDTPGSSVEETLDDCQDLMSKLNLAIDAEDPPLHLEKGVRLIHSLRSRMKMRMSRPPLKSRINRQIKQYKSSTSCINAADRATVDLLFWLGVMFDTLSSAMHKRPLVLSDEDSNVYANEPDPASDHMQHSVEALTAKSTEGVWDAHLFAHQRIRMQQQLVRWPCSFEQAAALLCDAAPVKVLLFRKVTRIQTLLARSCRGERVERSIKAALSVCEHWEQIYAPFIRDCVQHHDDLPSRIQSWYICLTGHWHLATLLLSDLVEIVDDSDFGLKSQQACRVSSNFVSCFRRNNCQALSDLARCACPRDSASFSQSRSFHSALSQGALLTEPWTAVLIRAFAKAGVVLLETEGTLPRYSSDHIPEAEAAFRRADDCVKALWYLGRKSDMALSAAKILGDALKQKRKGAEEKIEAMSSYLEAEMWQGFNQLDDSVEWDCSV